MKQIRFIIPIIILLFLSCNTNTGNFSQGNQDSNLKYVDPKIGSVGVILQATRLTVQLPNSMVRVFPIRKDQLDDQISNFHLTITSHRLNKVL